MNILEKLYFRIPLPSYPYRMYNHRYACIFVHIPKNAGTSVIRALGHDNGRLHVEWHHYYESNPYWFNRYHKFAICRNPFSRMISAYQYVISGGNHSVKDLALKEKVIGSCADINAFIQDVLTEEFILENTLFKPQYLFVCDTQHLLVVDTIIRFEQLSEDWRMLSNKLNLNLLIGSENASKQETITLTTIHESNQDKIRSLYHHDFEIFGY